MWSRKPTPVARVPAPLPSRPRRERDVGLAGLAGDLRGARHRRGFSRLASIDAAWASKPSARGDRGARRRPAPRRGGADADLGHAAAEVADVEAGGEARGALGRAACGWSPRRSRRTRCRRCAPTNRQPARAHARGERLGRRRPRAAGARARAPRRRPARRPSSRPTWIPAPASARRAAPASSLTATTSESVAVLGLRAQVGGSARRVGAARVSDHVRGRTGRRSRRCRRARRPGAWPPARRGCPARRSRRRGGSTRSRSASAAIACAPPMREDLVGAAQRARRRGSPGAAGAATTTSSTPAARAVTAPITTEDGYGCAARRARRRPRARTGTSRSAHGLALRERRPRLVVEPGLARPRARWRSRAPGPADVGIEGVERAASAAGDAAARGARQRTPRRPVRRRTARSYSATAGVAARAHALDDLRHLRGHRRGRRAPSRGPRPRPRRRSRPCSYAARGCARAARRSRPP